MIASIRLHLKRTTCNYVLTSLFVRSVGPLFHLRMISQLIQNGLSLKFILIIVPVYHLHPISLNAPIFFDEPQVESEVILEPNAPVIRKSFPESWIFDELQKYVFKLVL